MKIPTKLVLVLFVVTFWACKDASTTNQDKTVDSSVEASTKQDEGNVILAQSRVLWKGTKPTGEHNGLVRLKEGHLDVSDRTITGGRFVLDMHSIENLDLSGNSRERLENHLKGTVEGKEDHFFNVNKYPTAEFILHKVVPLQNNESNVHIAYGDLTMKDQTHPVQIPIYIEFSDDEVSVKSSPFTIDRTLWGVNHGSKTIFDDLKDNFLNDYIGLVIEIKAKR